MDEVDTKLLDLLSIQWKDEDDVLVVSVGFLIEESESSYVLAPSIFNWKPFGDCFFLDKDDVTEVTLLTNNYSANRKEFH